MHWQAVDVVATLTGICRWWDALDGILKILELFNEGIFAKERCCKLMAL